MMRFFILTLFLSLKAFSGEEVELDIQGESEVDDSDNGKMIITVKNDFNHDVSIFFVNQAEDSLLHMFDIGPNGEERMNSFVGHQFVATSDIDSQEDILSTISVIEGVYYYFFTPSTNSNTAKATVSKDTKSYHDNLHPAVTIIGRKSTSTNSRFRSLSSRVLDLWYDDGGEGIFQGRLKMGQDTSTSSYEGHTFYYTPHGDKSNVLGRITVTKDQVFYLLHDEEFPATQDIVDYTNNELDFLDDYLNSTGLHWRSFYGREGPRPPPVLYMWPAEEVGQVHEVISYNSKWHCSGKSADCQSDEPVPLKIEVISTHPKAFIIADFLSDFEVQSIVDVAAPQLHQSLVGDSDGGGISESDTRTSFNTWISRNRSPVFDTLYRRAADLLQIDEKLLAVGGNAEDIQVVHYAVGQKYDPHHDWGVNGRPESRYITLLLYLNDMKHKHAGGQTSFPKAADGRGIKVHPGKGSAVLFYNLLEDGNSDDLSLHEAVPVVDGEKWLANFWIWDPTRK